MDYSGTRAQIEEALVRAREMGITLCRVNFGHFEPGGYCCPMTAVAAGDLRFDETAFDAAVRTLGLSEREVWRFIDGWDGIEHLSDEDRAHPLYVFGQELAGRYL